MEQFEKVLKPQKGMYYILCEGENGEQILKLVPNKMRYFTKITSKDRKKVEKWLKEQRGSTPRERTFLFNVSRALESIDYDYWIATMEPTVICGRINYIKGAIVGERFSVAHWKHLANEYAPEFGSRLAQKSELFLWYALRIVNKLWTFDYVANDSSSGANYKNAPKTCGRKEEAGARLCGGYYDGQGNTRKLVMADIFCGMVGGNYQVTGFMHPIADIWEGFSEDLSFLDDNSVGVLVLTKYE